jgi:predicted nucleic acid-binding protein
MILVDTSVWVDHLRASDPALVDLLERAEVLMHPAVVGEVALGNLRDRDEILTAMGALPHAVVADDPEVMQLIESEGLHGHGIGYLDACVLAAARLSAARLWTRDGRLATIAGELGVAAP